MATRFEDVSINGTCYVSNWYRTFGDCGWYSETYGGGIYMIDTTWVRIYGNKNLYANGEIRGEVRISAGNGANRIEPSNWDKIILCANGTSTGGGYFYYNSGNAYGVISDRRIKNDIEDLTKTDAIDFIKELRPVTYSIKSDIENKKVCGFIAQEVLIAAKNEAQKNIVSKHETYDETIEDCPLIGVSDHSITPNIVSVLQVLIKKTEELSAKNDELMARLSALESNNG